MLPWTSSDKDRCSRPVVRDSGDLAAVSAHLHSSEDPLVASGPAGHTDASRDTSAMANNTAESELWRDVDSVADIHLLGRWWDIRPVSEDSVAAAAAAVAVAAAVDAAVAVAVAVAAAVVAGSCSPPAVLEEDTNQRGQMSKTLSGISRFEEHSWTAKSSCASGLRGQCQRYRRTQHLAETQGLYGDYGASDHDGPPWGEKICARVA